MKNTDTTAVSITKWRNDIYELQLNSKKNPPLYTHTAGPILRYTIANSASNISAASA